MSGCLPIALTSPKPAIGIVLIGSQRVVLESLVSLFASESDLRVLGTSGSDGATPPPAGNVDIAIVDLDDAGDDVFERLQKTAKAFRTIVLSISTDAALALRVFQAGAVGVVSKREPPALLLAAIRRVHAGEAWVGRTMIAEVLDLARLERQKGNGGGKSGKPALSARDRRLIALVGEGWRNADIARQLVASEATVRAGLTSIFRKLDLPNRFALMIYASQHGYVNAAQRQRQPALFP